SRYRTVAYIVRRSRIVQFQHGTLSTSLSFLLPFLVPSSGIGQPRGRVHFHRFAPDRAAPAGQLPLPHPEGVNPGSSSSSSGSTTSQAQSPVEENQTAS